MLLSFLVVLLFTHTHTHTRSSWVMWTWATVNSILTHSFFPRHHSTKLRVNLLGKMCYVITSWSLVTKSLSHKVSLPSAIKLVPLCANLTRLFLFFFIRLSFNFYPCPAVQFSPPLTAGHLIHSSQMVTLAFAVRLLHLSTHRYKWCSCTFSQWTHRKL